MQQDIEPQQEEPQQEEPQHLPQTTPTPKKPQESQPEECDICLHAYKQQERRPRALPCGHTFCSLCLASLITDSRLSCPSCCTNHPAPDATHFPVNYALENMMKKLSIQQDKTAPEADGESTEALAEKTRRRTVAGLSKKLCSMIQEQKGSLESVQGAVHQELHQLGQYRTQLALSLAKHGSLLELMDKMSQQHRDAVQLLQEEDLKVEAFMEEGEDSQKELKAAQDQLDSISTAQQAFSIIDSADHSTVVAEDWLQLGKEEFPNSTAYSTSCRVVMNTEAALQVVMDGKDTPVSPAPGHPDSSIMEVVKKIHDRSVELMDLRTNSKFKKMVENGQVFGIEKKEDGTSLFSRVTCDGDKLFLHSMRDQTPPVGTFTFRVHEAVKNFPVTKVFMDLASPGVATQRLHIRLTQDTTLTRHFVSLCLGFLGPTYRNTKFTNVENVNGCKVVWGEDISSQTSVENGPLPPVQANLCGETPFSDSGRVVVLTELSNPLKISQFGITILSPMAAFSFKLYYPVGKVETGLNVVEEAINSNRIGDLNVVDCGVVLSVE